MMMAHRGDIVFMANRMGGASFLESGLLVISTLYVLVGIVVVFGAMHVRLIQRYFKTKNKLNVYMGLFFSLIAIAAFFGILIAAATAVNNSDLAELFYRASTSSGTLAYVFLNAFAVTATDSAKKRGVWISLAAFLIIMLIIWTFNPIVEGVIDGTTEFTLTSMFKEPYGLPLIEVIFVLMITMAAYPIYLFFRTAKDSKETTIKSKSLLMGIGFLIADIAYFMEVTSAVSYKYMPIYRPMILIGALILALGYETPKWLERKIARHAPVSEKPTGSPLEQFFLQQVAPKARSRLGAFSEALGLNHEQMTGRKILLEFNPASNYEKIIQDFATEALANAERLVIFTRRGSSIHSSLREYEAVKFFCFTQQFSIPKESTENEMLLPSGDTSLILDVLDKALKMNPEEAVNVIFDNLSDLLLSIGFDKTYRFIRYVVEMLSSPKNTVIFLLNQTAHEPNVISSLKGLFSDQVFCEEKGLQIIKLQR